MVVFHLVLNLLFTDKFQGHAEYSVYTARRWDHSDSLHL